MRAVAAASSEPGRVQALVDDSLNCSIFAASAESIRQRVSRAETAFRAGRGNATSESTLVDAINGAVSIAFAPEALKTSEDQVHAFRIMLNAAMPHFIGVSNAMSPAEAVFVTGFLTQQKLFDPGYKFVDTHPRSAKLVVRQMSQEMADVENAFREQLPHEWSLVTISVHLFLDRAGLPR